MIESKKKEYWRGRASGYSKFKWARDPGYLSVFIGACDFKEDDFVLDLGCGPGIISRAAIPHVGRLIGMDNSIDMLLECDGDFNFMLGDASEIPFPDNTFDKILARNVFHHLFFNLLGAARESLRVLKPGGQIIVGERIPPSEKLLKEWESMLALKDKRICFTTHKLFRLLDSVGYEIFHSFPYTISDISVREWLRKSGLPDEIKDEIYGRHMNGSPEFRKGLNMRITDQTIQDWGDPGDLLIDIKNIIMVAGKL